MGRRGRGTEGPVDPNSKGFVLWLLQLEEASLHKIGEEDWIWEG